MWYLSVVRSSSIKIAPSMLSCDFLRMGQEVAAIEAAGADYVHVDVMDGHFVPNLTIGPPIVAALRRATKLPLDVHLMIENPERWIDAYADAGADLIGVHVEACTHLHRTLQAIAKRQKKACAVLNPATSLATLEWVLPQLDMVLLMSVNPGFGGQAFIAQIEDKVRQLAAMRLAAGVAFDIQVDGGVTEQNIGALAAAGANVFVAGTAVFGQGDYAKAIGSLRQTALLASAVR